MKFCPKCDAMLESNTSDGVIKFKCLACENTDIAVDPRDTLILTIRIKPVEYDKQHRDAAKLPSTKLVEKTCKECNAKHMSQIYTDKDISMRPLYICKCGAYETTNV